MSTEERLAEALATFLASHHGGRLASDLGMIEIHGDGRISLTRTPGSVPEVYTVTITCTRSR